MEYKRTAMMSPGPPRAPRPMYLFQDEPGFAIPQYGQSGSSELISFRQFGHSIGSGIVDPVGTITAGGGGKTALVYAFIAKHFGGVVGHEIERPAGTITTKDHNSLVTSYLVKLRGTCKAGQPVDKPLHTVTSGGTHIGEVRVFLIKYYGQGCGQMLTDPAATVTTKDHIGLVTVHGEPYVITDIGMRMLSPRELFRAQGFSDEYKIDIEIAGKPITKTDQVRCCGNSVCPPMARALVEANYETEQFKMPVKKAYQTIGRNEIVA